jgi:hypothetical protein
LQRRHGVNRQQFPSEGFGPLVHKRYWVDIDGSPHRAAALRDVFRRNVAVVMPLERVGPVTHLKKNQTFTVTLALGGALPMRVDDILPARIVCATLEGHPLAGLVTFDFIERGRQVRFEVGVHARIAGTAGALLMAPLDGLLQDGNWTAVAERVVEVSGGRAPAGVQSVAATLDGEEAWKIEEWAESLAVRRLRGRVPPGPPIDGRRRAVRKPPATAAPRKPARRKPAQRKPARPKPARPKPAPRKPARRKPARPKPARAKAKTTRRVARRKPSARSSR